MSANIHERVGKLGARVDNVIKRLDDIVVEIRDLRILMNSWVKWILGLSFTGWVTLMAAILLKK